MERHDLVSTRQLVELAGVSYRQADYWTRVGYLEPVVEAVGSGSRRLYDLDEVAVATVLGSLMRSGLAGVAQRVVYRVTATLRAMPVEDWGRPVLLTADGDRTDQLAHACWVVQLPDVRALAAA